MTPVPGLTCLAGDLGGVHRRADGRALPEYRGKKIEAREIKLTVLGLLATPLMALFCTAMAVASKSGRASIFSPGKPQAFSETFYAYLSQANNNGSAFAGYTGHLY